MHFLYTEWSKKVGILFCTPYKFIRNYQFSNCFHCQNQENICNGTVTKHSTAPQVCRYTTLWNISVLKVTINWKQDDFQECVVGPAASPAAANWRGTGKRRGAPHPFPFPSLSLEVGPLESSFEVWGSAVSSPSGVWGGAPTEIEFAVF